MFMSDLQKIWSASMKAPSTSPPTASVGLEPPPDTAQPHPEWNGLCVTPLSSGPTTVYLVIENGTLWGIPDAKTFNNLPLVSALDETKTPS
jgi:hypothetical protein